MRRALLVALAAAALIGCEEELEPETLVKDLRVLGVRSCRDLVCAPESPQVAELRPGETAALDSLVVNPARRDRPTRLWIGCDPDPQNLNRTACSNLANLEDPASLIQVPEDGGAPQLPPGMRFIGVDQRAAYRAPADLFARLAPEDPQRRLGTVAQVLLIAVAEEVSPAATPEELRGLFDRVSRREVRSLVSIFRIRVTEEAPNQNPALGTLLVGGEPLARGATVRVGAGETVTLELTAPDAAFEAYDQITPTGVEPRTERLIAAWYATSGRFSDERITLRSETPLEYRAAGTEKEPVPERRSGSLFAVVRDTRGGQSWIERPLFICDPSLPAPSVSSVEPATAAAGATVTLRGERVGSVLDVVIGDDALARLACSEATGTCLGELPALPSGSHAIRIRGRHCADVETALRFELAP